MESNNNKEDKRWQLKINGDHRFRHENTSFNIDVWYPLLQDLTFKSYFIPLERKEANAMYKYYNKRYLSRGEITYKEVEILNNLENKIDTFIKNNENLSKNGAFIRLSGRSPKDGDGFDLKKFYNEYLNNLNKLSKELNIDKKDGNLRVNAISRTHTLKVNNGKDAMSLLLTSERVHCDMSDWLNNGGKEQIVLREFNNDLNYDDEFRAFIYNYKLTAISQYDHYGMYNHVIKEKDIIEKAINDFWLNNVKNRIKFPDYVVDFCYVKGKVILIEISPFLQCTGASCYRWYLHLDELKNGNGKLKVKTEEYPNVYVLTDEWEERFKGKDDKYYDFYVKESLSNKFFNLFNFIFNNDNNNDRNYFLFVGSVLKNGFYWNKKFLNQNSFYDEGTCNGIEIIVDESGMGYFSKGNKIKGEIWKVNEDELIDIEYFYNICDKKNIIVNSKNNGDVNCIYFERKEEKKENEKSLDFYSLDFQKENYNPILHQILIEENYLQYKLKI